MLWILFKECMLKNNGKYFKLLNLIRFVEILISLNLKEIQNNKIKKILKKIMKKYNLLPLRHHPQLNNIKRLNKNIKNIKMNNKYK